MILSKTINLMAFFETCRQTLSNGLVKLEIYFSSDDFFLPLEILKPIIMRSYLSIENDIKMRMKNNRKSRGLCEYISLIQNKLHSRPLLDIPQKNSYLVNTIIFSNTILA